MTTVDENVEVIPKKKLRKMPTVFMMKTKYIFFKNEKISKLAAAFYFEHFSYMKKSYNHVSLTYTKVDDVASNQNGLYTCLCEVVSMVKK